MNVATAEMLVYVFSNLRFLKCAQQIDFKEQCESWSRRTIKRRLARRQNYSLQLAELAPGSLAAFGPEKQQLCERCDVPCSILQCTLASACM